MHSVKPVHLTIDKTDGYIKESYANKDLSLVSPDRNKDILKKYTELWNKNEDLIRSITNTSGDYYKKYVKVKFN